MQGDLPVNLIQMKKGAGVLRVLNNSFHQVIIKELHARKRSNVGDLYQKIRCEQSVIPQHLRILREDGFVLTERDGEEIYYPSIMNDLLKWIGW